MTKLDSQERNAAALVLYRAARADGRTVDDALTILRAAGYRQIPSIRAIHDTEGISLGDAKAIVDLSPTWSDHLEGRLKFYDMIEELIESENGEATRT